MEESITTREYPEYSTHWLEDIITEIEKRDQENIVLSTGKTPSGHIHLGILRELLICDAIKRILTNRGNNVRFILFIDSLDAAKRFPPYIPEVYNNIHLGKPFSLLPNPFQNDGRNYAQFFGEELAATFQEFGIGAEITWTHELYKTDRMKDMIRIGLKKNVQVKEIIAKYLTASMTDEQKSEYLEQQADWMGAMVICERCQCTQKKQDDGSITPNRVLSFDEKTDSCEYICPACGFHGYVTVSSGLVKLNWRLDWPAKWTLYQTTCEPAGKDHCTPGGSYDTGLDLCRNIYGYQGPVKVSYEWVRLGDRDMKTSKGIVFTPQKFLDIADPEIIRLLIYQTSPNKHLSIRIEELEQYYNELERIEKIYYNVEPAPNDDIRKEIEYIYPLICTNKPLPTMPIKIPFKVTMILAQLLNAIGMKGIESRAKEYLKTIGRNEELDLNKFHASIQRAINWLEEMKTLISEEKNPEIIKKLSQKVMIFSILDQITPEIQLSLDDSQKQVLKMFGDKISGLESLTEENTKDIMMNIRDKLNLKPMKVFQAFYQILLGEKKGPRLGPLLSMLDKEWILTRIRDAID